MRFFFPALLVLALDPALASAQSRLLVMGDPAARDAIADALRVELASRGTEVIATDPPIGDTRAARAANAQANARAAGADAAVWCDLREEGWLVWVVPSADAGALHAPLATTTDPRAVAVVAASLLDEMGVPAAPEVYVDPPDGIEDVPAGTTSPEGERVPPVGPAVAGAGLHAYGMLGIGAVGVVWNEVEVGLGPMVRGGLGLRFADTLRIGIDGDVYTSFDDRSRVLPTVRIGPSIALELRVSDALLVFEGHVRGVASTILVTSETSPGLPGGGLVTDDGRMASDPTRVFGVSAGGRVALELALEAGLALAIGLELDGMALETQGAVPPCVAALSVGLTWR